MVKRTRVKNVVEMITKDAGLKSDVLDHLKMDKDGEAIEARSSSVASI